jgi:hypothetical protein
MDSCHETPSARTPYGRIVAMSYMRSGDNVTRYPETGTRRTPVATPVQRMHRSNARRTRLFTRLASRRFNILSDPAGFPSQLDLPFRARLQLQLLASYAGLPPATYHPQGLASEKHKARIAAEIGRSFYRKVRQHDLRGNPLRHLPAEVSTSVVCALYVKLTGSRLHGTTTPG